MKTKFIQPAAVAMLLAQVGSLAWTAFGAVEGQNTVFAHYMTCFTQTVPDVKREILLAQQYGIDGWALNCGNWKRQDPKTGEWKPFDGYVEKSTRCFKAAEELGTGFKFFFSPDGNLHSYTNNFHADMLLMWKDHPNHFRYDGRPLFSGWGGGNLKNEKYRFAREDLNARGVADFLLVPELGPKRNVMYASKDLAARQVYGDPNFMCDGQLGRQVVHGRAVSGLRQLEPARLPRPRGVCERMAGHLRRPARTDRSRDLERLCRGLWPHARRARLPSALDREQDVHAAR